MNNQTIKITKVEHVWINRGEDRWIYIEYNEQYKIIGLNFMQGDDYDYFKAKFCYNDKELTGFYKTMIDTFTIEEANTGTMEFINKVIGVWYTDIKPTILYNEQY